MHEVNIKIKKLGSITLVIVFLLTFISITSNLKPWEGNSWVASQIQRPIYFVEILWHKTSQSIKENWSYYINLSKVAKENRKIRRQLLKLKSEKFILEAKENELNRIKETLGFLKKFDQNILEEDL